MRKYFVLAAALCVPAIFTVSSARENYTCDQNGRVQNINGTAHTCAVCNVDGNVTRVWYVGELDGATAESTCQCQHNAGVNCSAASAAIIRATRATKAPKAPDKAK